MIVAVQFTTIPCKPNTADSAKGHILFLVNIHPCSKGILYAGIKDFRTFLCIFISFVKVSMCLELVANVPVSIFFAYEGLVFLSNNNLLLTEREGCTGEYWPEVVTVRTERSKVRTKRPRANIPQYGSS